MKDFFDAMKTATIRITYDPPPIPSRAHDWCAVRDDYDLGRAVGHGPSPTEALYDLLEMEELRCAE